MTAHTWNTDRETLQNGSVRSQISVGWRNYLRRKQVWQPINTDLQSDRSVTAFPGCLQLPESSQGWAEICVDGTFSMKRHIEEGNGNNAEPDFEMSLAVETQHNITGHISETNPAQMVYPNAWDSADLKLGLWRGRSVRIEKVVEIKSMPSGDSEFIDYSFLIRSNKAQVLAGPDHNANPWDESGHAELDNADAFVSLTGSQLRGTVLRTPVAWYYVAGQMVRVPVLVTFDIQSDGETVRATKHIPRSLITTALAAGSHLFTDATFTPDASPETNSVDGYVLRSVNANTWSDLRDGAGTYTQDHVSSASCLRLKADADTDKYDIMGRAFYFHDTSSIGAGQQVDSGTFTATHEGTRSYTSYELTAGICGSDSSSTTALANSDFESAQFASFSSDGIAQSAAATWTAYDFDLNAAGIAAVDPEGMTRICLLDKTYDLADSAPTWGQNHEATFGWYFAEQSAPAGRAPVLEVIHSEAASFNAGYAINSNPEVC